MTQALTKTYFMDYEIDESEVHCDGPNYVRAEGCVAFF
jgi:hypothetical protein